MATFSNSNHAETLILDTSSSSYSSSSGFRRPLLPPRNLSSTISPFSSPPPPPSFPKLCNGHGPFLSTSLPTRRPISPSFPAGGGGVTPAAGKKACMCSPTTHPGSFRCSLHRSTGRPVVKYSNRLSARRSAMVNSIVRIGGVEGEIIERALKSLIRPSSNNLRRREVFRPQPSRLSKMSMAEDCV